MRPRLSASRPAAARLSFSVAPIRPAANSSISLVMVRPLASVVTTRPVCATSIRSTAEPRRSATLRSRRSWVNSSISSRSMKSRKVEPRVDQRHRHVERVEDRRVLDADDAGADHRQAARQLRQLDDLVAVEHRRPVERNVIRPQRRRAGGDENAGGRVAPRVAVRLRDLDLVRTRETRLALGGSARHCG